MSAWAIVVAAGSGERLGGTEPKAFRALAGIPMLAYSLRAAGHARAVQGIVVVAPVGHIEDARDVCAGNVSGIPVHVVAGGDTRQASVRAGLGALPGGVTAVAVHDAARPLATPDLFERALHALAEADGAVCAVPLADTLKRADDGDRIAETVPRDRLWRAQTPQAFRLEILARAHDRAAREGIEATDDAALVEREGGSVMLVRGDERNLKITTPADAVVAEALLSEAAR